MTNERWRLHNEVEGGRDTGSPLANQNFFSEAYWHTANYINQGNKEDWY